MRARIANELARVERARLVLIERSEELARSNADLEQFAYVASHDLSEPLRKVANFCQLLERQYAAQLDDKAKQYIAFAVDGAKRMQMLIADLLSFSRVGRSTENFEPSTPTARSAARSPCWTTASSTSDAEHRPRPAADGRRGRDAADGAVPEPGRQRAEVPQPGAHPARRDRRREAGRGLALHRDRQRHRYRSRSTPSGSSRSSSDCTCATSTAAPASGWRYAARSSSSTAGKIWLGENDGPGATFHFSDPRARGIPT